MNKFLKNKLTIIYVAFCLLFNLSCNDDDLPSNSGGGGGANGSSSSAEYSLDVQYSVFGGDGANDYNDKNIEDESVITFTLGEIDDEGNIIPLDDKDLHIQWSVKPSNSAASTYSTIWDVDGNDISDSGNIVKTDASGRVILTWRDEGYEADEVEIIATYEDAAGVTKSSEPYKFEILSIYSKIAELTAIDYIFEEVDDLEANTSEEGFLNIRVLDINGSGVAGAAVELEPHPTFTSLSGQQGVSFPDFITLSTTESETGPLGTASFPISITQGDLLQTYFSTQGLNVETFPFTAKIVSENLNCVEDDNGTYVISGSTLQCALSGGSYIISKPISLTVTSEEFSIEDYLYTISIDASPSELILSDGQVSTITLNAVALTEGSSIIDPPTDKKIDFRFSFTGDNVTYATFTTGMPVPSETGEAEAFLEINESYIDFLNSNNDSIRYFDINVTIEENGVTLTDEDNDIISGEIGNYTIKSLEAILAGQVSAIYMSSEPNYILYNPGDGLYSVTITATVIDAFGGPVSGINVYFTDLSSNSTGVLTPAIATTNANGQAVTNLNNIDGSNLGVLDINATIPGTENPSDSGNPFSASIAVPVTNPENEAYAILSELSLTISPYSDFDGDQIPEIIFDDINLDESGNYETIKNIDLLVTATNLNDATVENLPVYFSNLTPDIGNLTSDFAYTDSLGNATVTLSDIRLEQLSDPSSIDSLEVKAYVIDPDTPDHNNPVIEKTIKAYIGKQTVANIFQVDQVDVDFVDEQIIIDVNNIGEDPYAVFEDDLVVQVLNSDGSPIENVPVQFSIQTTNEFGYISDDVVLTNNQGYATTTFTVTQLDLEQASSTTMQVILNVYISDDFEATKTLNYVIAQSGFIASNVEQFNLYPASSENLHVYTYPNNDASMLVPFIAKDDSGVRLQGVPVEFKIVDPSTRMADGSINISESYTCCVDTLQQLVDWDGDGIITTDENKGIAAVQYTNALNNVIDTLSARILDPVDDEILLHEERVRIWTYPIESLVNADNSFSYIDNDLVIFDDISESDSSSTSIDLTISTNINDDNGIGIANFPVRFENMTPSYGTLSNAQVSTNNTGLASVTLSDVSILDATIMDELTIKAYVLNRDDNLDTLYKQYVSASIGNQSVYNALEVESFTSELLSGSTSTTLYDISSNYVDQLLVQVFNTNSTPASNIPVQLSITSNIGYITETLLYSDNEGKVSFPFTINSSDLSYNMSEQVTFDIFISDTINNQIIHTYSVLTLESLVDSNNSFLSINPTVILFDDVSDSGSTNIDVEISAHIKNASGEAIPDVPVQFENGTPEYGTMPETTTILTNSNGIANITLSNVSIINSSIVDQLVITATVVDPVSSTNVFTDTIQADIANQSTNDLIEITENIDQFNYYPITIDDIDVYTYINQSATKRLPFIVKGGGTRIEGVPVEFEIYGNSLRAAHGTISTSEAYTCCTSDADSLYDFNGDGTITIDENRGIASVLYSNDLNGAIDSLSAKIINPNNESQILFEEKVNINTYPIENLLNSDNSFTTMDNSLIIFDDISGSDSIATSYNVAINANIQDVNGIGIENLLVRFENRTPGHGILSGGEIETNTDGIASVMLNNVSVTEINQTALDSVKIKAYVLNRDDNLDTLYRDYVTAIVANQSVYNAVAVNQVSSTWLSPNTLITDVTQTFRDTAQTRVLDVNGSPLENVLVQFSLSSNFGQLDVINNSLTDSYGMAYTAFNALPIDLTTNSGTTDNVTITSSVNGNPESSINRTYTIFNQYDLDTNQSFTLMNSLEIDDVPATDSTGTSPSCINSSEDVFGICDGISASDSTYSILIESLIKNIHGTAVANLPVYYENITPQFGILANSISFTDSVGRATNTLGYISIQNPTIVDTIKIRAYAQNPFTGSIIYDDTTFATIANQSVLNQRLVTNLDFAFLQDLSVINNINLQYTDTLYAQVLDQYNVPVPGVPINFSLVTPDIGYINENYVFTGPNGIAVTSFIITPADMEQELDNNDPAIDIEVMAYTNDIPDFTLPSQTIDRTYLIEGSANVSDDVADFRFCAVEGLDIIDDRTIYGNPCLGADTTSSKFTFQVRDTAGVVIENVPVHFGLSRNSGGMANGTLLNSLEFSVLAPDSVDILDQSPEAECTSYEPGTVTAHYCNEFPNSDGYDILTAYITDPDDQSSVIYQQSVNIYNYPSCEEVSSENGLYSFGIPEVILMENVDSTYCDTITSIALNDNGQFLDNILIEFSLDSEDQDLGYISNYQAVTDSIPGTGIIGARTAFCTYPNITLANEDTINVDVSIPCTNSQITDEVVIPIIENLPECPDCQASLVAISEYYELPAEDNTIFTTQITATVIDSTENPVPENTLVEFQSLTENEDGDLVPIGSINPYEFTDSLGKAYATFNMETDVGLAQIIVTAPEYNLADTLFLNLTSTDAASMELIAPFPNEIMVQGGGGQEATELTVRIKDGSDNLVTEPFFVHFEILPSAPLGVYLNENDGTGFSECAESSNGLATVTLNSGSQPGSVPIRVSLYPNDLGVDCESINTNTYTTFGIANLESVPVTVVTGPPEFGLINYSYVDITSIGGGLYQVPLSVSLWDFYSNPVADSTNVYIWIEGIADAWEGIDSTYTYGDTIKWGGLDENDNPIIVDSLLYVWNVEGFSDDQLANPSPGDGLEITGTPLWLPVAHPGDIIGEAKTGMEAPDGQAYPGVAWSNVYYGTSNIFDNTVIKALCYDSDGDKLIIDSRENHNGEPLVLPFQPGTLAAGVDINFWNFSVFGDVGLNDLDDTVAVQVTANLTDFYQYPVDNGTVLLNATGANIWLVCDPADTDGDGYVGECWEDTNGSGALEIPPTPGADTQNDDLGLTCSVCSGNGGFWNYDDSDGGEFNAFDGDGIIDDDPSFGTTNSTGQINWLISYTEALNAGDGNDPESYADFTSTIILNLLDPLQTASDGVDVLLVKTELNDND